MRRNILFVAISAFLLTACSDTGRSARVNPISVATFEKEQIGCFTSDFPKDHPRSIDLDCYKMLEIGKDSPTYKPAFELALSDMKYRNGLQEILVNRANILCEAEKGGIYANRAVLDSTFDIATSALSTAGTIVSGELAKSILAGGAGFSNSTRNSLNSNIYQNQIVPAITKVMDAERSKILIKLEANKSQELDRYSAYEMVRLANEYHQACSFQNGVKLLLDAAINKEGVDSIIRGINISSAVRTTQNHLTSLEARERSGLDPAEAAKTRNQLEERLRQLMMLEMENLKTAVVTAPAIVADPAD